jgi:hypothetical protein
VHAICERATATAAQARMFPVWLIHSVRDDLAADGARGIAAIPASKPGATRSAGINRRAQAQRPMLAAGIIAGTLLSLCGSVMAQTDAEKQAQCELSAIRDTRSSVAIQSIRSACNWLALNGDSRLQESSRNYHICLVRQLSGVQADQAAGAIVAACRTSYPP